MGRQIICGRIKKLKKIKLARFGISTWDADNTLMPFVYPAI